MDDFAYVLATSSTKSQTTDCPQCQPPVLCLRHAADLTATRREREATLLRAF